MPRIHAFEILDHPRCPHVIRDGATDYLQFIIRIGRAYAPVVPALAQALRATNVTRIVDLCSGGGGPWPELREFLVAAGASPQLTVCLTDRFPNRDAFAVVHDREPAVFGEHASVDAECVRESLHGFRTLFSSFHHFAPQAARRVLADAIARREGICIAEITRRHIGTMLFILLSPLLVLLATPALRPFRASRLFWTYLIPAIPFVVCFDGIVSCLRTYSANELRGLITDIGDTSYRWTIGEVRGRGPMRVTYAIGTPG